MSQPCDCMPGARHAPDRLFDGAVRGEEREPLFLDARVVVTGRPQLEMTAQRVVRSRLGLVGVTVRRKDSEPLLVQRVG